MGEEGHWAIWLGNAMMTGTSRQERQQVSEMLRHPLVRDYCKNKIIKPLALDFRELQAIYKGLIADDD